jgi:hypothetical protein
LEFFDFVTRARMVKQEDMTAARNIRPEADAIVGRLPES